MSKHKQYLVEGITKDITMYLMRSIKEFYNSETFAKLSNEETGLYIESSAYVYEIFKEEMSRIS